MKVFELRKLSNTFISARAVNYEIKLQRQKLGFTISDKKNKAEIIDTILIKALIASNKSLAHTEEARIPSWITRVSFNKFISKIN